MRLLAPIFLINLILQTNPIFAKTGFQSGDHFTTHNLAGDVIVYCFDPSSDTTQINSEHCTTDVLSPSEWDFFVDDTGIEADNIGLKVTQAGGKIREQSSEFVAAQGRSRHRFNLWVNTLFQRSLLTDGINQVEYTFRNNRKIVSQGHYNIEVERGNNLVCEPRSYNSNYAPDCQTGAYCNRFFQDQNYCEQ